jgi:hypothetical protein
MRDVIVKADDALQTAAIATNIRRRQAAFDLRLQRRRKLKPVNATWRVTPGEVGFNAYALQRMQALDAEKTASPAPSSPESKAARTNAKLLANGTTCRGEPIELKVYQKTVPYLLSAVPNHRMLVAHRTGAGKTLTIIETLSKLYSDPRIKVVVFPTQTLVAQFREDLLGTKTPWPNPYRDFARRALGPGFRLSDGVELVETRRYTQADAAHGPPGGGLKVMAYNQLGNKLQQTGFNADTEGCEGAGVVINGSYRPNWFCNKVLIMDEAHNLIRPSAEIIKLKVQRDNLNNARGFIFRAVNSVIGLFTATPNVSDAAPGPELKRFDEALLADLEGQGAPARVERERLQSAGLTDLDRMLALVKGAGRLHLSDEGFVSSFYGAPTPTYPRTSPGTGELPNVVQVELRDTILEKYLDHGYRTTEAGLVLKEPKKIGSLDVYQYTAHYPYSTGRTRADFVAALKTDRAKMVAPKLYAAAELLLKAKGKAIVLTNKRHGLYAMTELIERNEAFKALRGKVATLVGNRENVSHGVHPAQNRPRCPGGAGGDQGEACAKASFDAIANRFGDRSPKVLVLNSKHFSEGVDFKDVRLVILLDVPTSWSEYEQKIGRAIRSCSHQTKNPDGTRPPDSHNHVEVQMLVATLPRFAVRKKQTVDLRTLITPDEENLERLIEDRSKDQALRCRVMFGAVDRAAVGDPIPESCGVRDDTPPPPPPPPEAVAAADARLTRCANTLAKELGRADAWARQERWRRAAATGKRWEEYDAARKLAVEKHALCEDEAYADAGLDRGVYEHSENCPIGYSQTECVGHCGDGVLRLDGERLDRCVDRMAPMARAPEPAQAPETAAAPRRAAAAAGAVRNAAGKFSMINRSKSPRRRASWRNRLGGWLPFGIGNLIAAPPPSSRRRASRPKTPSRRRSVPSDSPPPPPSPPPPAPPPAIEGCPNCPTSFAEGACRAHCKDLGLQPVDAYRCVRRLNRPGEPCSADPRMSRPPTGVIYGPDGLPVPPGTPRYLMMCANKKMKSCDDRAPLPAMAMTQDGTLLERGGSKHRELCSETPPAMRDCRFPSTTSKKQHRRRASTKGNNVTKKELQQVCRDQGLPVSGTKAELEARCKKNKP